MSRRSTALAGLALAVVAAAGPAVMRAGGDSAGSQAFTQSCVQAIRDDIVIYPPVGGPQRVPVVIPKGVDGAGCRTLVCDFTGVCVAEQRESL